MQTASCQTKTNCNNEPNHFLMEWDLRDYEEHILINVKLWVLNIFLSAAQLSPRGVPEVHTVTGQISEV